jgi:hypothetical protein
MPTAVPTGTDYIFIYYQQIGGTPAITDTLLDSYHATWNGVILVPDDGSVILDPYALVTLNQIKYALPSIVAAGASDDTIKAIINQESARFEALTDRKIVNRYYKDYVRDRYGKIRPRQVPVTEITKMAGGYGSAFTITYQGSGYVRAVYFQDTSDIIHLKFWDISGNITENIYDTATYKSTATLLSALSGVSGISIQLMSVNPIPSDYLYRTAPVILMNENGGTNAYVYYAVNDTDYIIRNNGYVIGWEGADADYFLMEYYAGYVTVPYDIQSAVIEAVKISYDKKQLALNFKSESIGKYSYTLKDKDLPDSYWDVVRTYRRFGTTGR